MPNVIHSVPRVKGVQVVPVFPFPGLGDTVPILVRKALDLFDLPWLGPFGAVLVPAIVQVTKGISVPFHREPVGLGIGAVMIHRQGTQFGDGPTGLPML